MKIKYPMNEKNTNEKDQNVKDIVFDPCQNFVESNHPRYPRHILTHTIHAKTLCTHAIHSKVWPMPPTNRQYPGQPRYLADLNVFFFFIFLGTSRLVCFKDFFKGWWKYVYNVCLSDAKYKDIVFIAVYNQWDISATLSHRTSENSWYICQLPCYMT